MDYKINYMPEGTLYLDSAATSRVHECALKGALSASWVNPSALYAPAAALRAEIEKVRRGLSDFLGLGTASGSKGGVVFTSGGTESNNLAILDALASFARTHSARDASGHLPRALISGIDHASIYEAVHSSIFEVEEIPVDRNGRLILDGIDLRGAALLCVSHVNNELGTACDLDALSHALSALGPSECPKLLIDGVQALGKLPLSEIRRAVALSDYYTISAHKIHGLKGVGALVSAKPAYASHVGGGQESGQRGGTENVPGIMAFGEALDMLRDYYAGLSKKELGPSADPYISSAADAKKILISALKREFSGLEGALIINSPDDGSPYILSVSIEGAKSEIMIHMLADKGIYVSNASACSSTKDTVSRIIKKIGVPGSHADGTLRISLAPEFFYPEEIAKRGGGTVHRIAEPDLDRVAAEIFAAASEIRKYNM